MNIDAIGFLAPLNPIGAAQPEASAAPGAAFGTWFSQQLADVNRQLAVADHGVQRLAAGDASNLHQVMIDLEQAKVSLQLVMQVRNHLLDAYHELMQMQM
ncbi:flagellar hook-basal body complex protein FliE [Massilia sp. S19_KUP03_FR1]|uniref:flagellar hook-basal body complex protein FliE n=1 Tax=Massilia sp. S19_KUP03_FR1 TaxID=3025503 RepID=UPI002FCD8DF1